MDFSFPESFQSYIFVSGVFSFLVGLCTFVTKGSSISRWPTVTGKTFGSLHAATTVLAQHAVAAAVTRTSRLNPRSDVCSLLQVQGDAIQLESANTSPKALLPGRCASWKQTKGIMVNNSPFLFLFHDISVLATHLKSDFFSISGHPFSHCKSSSQILKDQGSISKQLILFNQHFRIKIL